MRTPILFLAALAAAPFIASAEPRYDVLIRGGRVVDGSGNPWYVADVGVRAGRVAAVGKLTAATAARVIEAAGLVVAPGFIDVHTHAEEGLRRTPTADNFVRDGVTTIVTGNCGHSEMDLPAFFSELEDKGLALNVASLVGHNGIRREVMGAEQREPTPEEQAAMEALVESAMRAGAVGLSTGLIYIPGTYAKTGEVVALARVAARHGGLYASHIRSEGTEVVAAVEEAIEVGRQASVPVEISHFKVANKKLWGRSARTLGLVAAARREGLDVTVDQYPYTASSTELGVLLPSWALADGEEAVAARLADAKARRRIAREMKKALRERNGRKRLDYAVVASCRSDPSLEGKSIAEINRQRGRKRKLENEIETVLELMEQGGARMIYHSMSPTDVERILRSPHSMVASDGGVVEFEVGLPHPRSYGTNARVLGHYVRERGLLSVEEAVRKMTSLPAQRFGFADRGLVRPGLWADLVLFDPDAVSDQATFDAPHAYSAGLPFVLVNGELVVDEGEHTGARSGRVLLGPGTH